MVDGRRQTVEWHPCRPISVAKALEFAGLGMASATEVSMWGLPAAIVVGRTG